MKKIGLLVVFLANSLFVAAQRKIVVAADNSGDYRTIQEAINHVPDNDKQETIIWIKKGVYKEKLVLPESKQHVRMEGENRDLTIITFDDYASKPDSAGKNIGTSGSATVHIYGNDFSAFNLTFKNSSGPVGQAVAVRATGDCAYFKNCSFLGYQDTLYTHGFGSRQLYEDCYIEGTVDFIFGAATAWFERCTLFCKTSGGYITAAATPDSIKYGYVFHHCHITGNIPSQSCFLGRPWRPYAKTVFIECDLGNYIRPEGWQQWSNSVNLNTTYYAEYHNTGESFLPARRLPWTHQLTAAEAAQYTRDNVLIGWNPAAKH